MSTAMIDRETFVNLFNFIERCRSKYLFNHPCTAEYWAGKYFYENTITPDKINSLMLEHVYTVNAVYTKMNLIKEYGIMQYEPITCKDKCDKISMMQFIKSIEAVLYNITYTTANNDLVECFKKCILNMCKFYVHDLPEYEKAVFG